MYNKKKKNHNKISNLLLNILISIKFSTLDFGKFFFIINLIDIANYIIVIDIIFNKNRNFINFNSYIYMINPIIYCEYLYNKECNNKNNTLYFNNTTLITLNEEQKNKDQISLLLNKIFKIQIYEQNYYNNFYILKYIILIFILFIFIFLSINSSNNIINILKKILVYILFIIFKPFLPTFHILFGRKIFIQISVYYLEFNYKILIDFLLYIIFIIYVCIFYGIIIYGYGNYEDFYFLKIKSFLFDAICYFLCNLIIILRYNIKYSIIFQLLFCITLVYRFIYNNIYYFSLINKIFLNKLFIIIDIIPIAFLIARFLTFIIFHFNYSLKMLKYFEIFLFLLILCLIFYYEYSNEIYFNISDFNKFLLEKNNLFFLCLFQLFYPLKFFILMKNTSNKITEKNRNQILSIEYKNFKKYFCTNKQDYYFLFGNEYEKIHLLNNNFENEIYRKPTIKNLNKKTNNDNDINKHNNINYLLTPEKNIDNNDELLRILFNFLKDLNLSIKTNFEDFFLLAKYYIKYFKIILYLILEGKTFRTIYLLKKTYNELEIKNKNIIVKSIFYFLEYHSKNTEKKTNENNLQFIILLLKINNKYLKIINSFKTIINNFSHKPNDLLTITSFENYTIGKYVKKIIDLKSKSKFLNENSENYEMDKYLFCESLLFNSGYNKSIESFDILNIDTLVDKNNYFVIYYTNESNFIIKKCPIFYNYLTNYKTSKLKNKNFINIFPQCLRKIIYKEIKKNIMKKNSFKFNAVFDDINNLIIYNKITFICLPSYKNKLYISCKFDINESKLIQNSSAIIDNKGNILNIGSIFIDYFGLNPLRIKTNIYKLLNVKEFIFKNVKNNNTCEIDVSYKKLYKNIEKNLINLKYYEKYFLSFKKNLKTFLQKIKEKKVGMKIKIELKNEFNINKNDKFQIIILTIEGISEHKTYNSLKSINNLEETSLKFSINNSVVSGITSNQLIKDNRWNITNKHNNDKFKNDNMQTISFIYNFLVVVIAIIFALLIKILLNNFKNDFIFTIFFRQFNSDYFYNHFYLINKLIISSKEYPNDFYESISEDFKKYNISFNITDFWDFHSKIESEFFLRYYHDKYKKYIKKIQNQKDSKFYKPMFEENISLFFNGENKNFKYYQIFNYITNFFYIISMQESINIKVPIINYDNIIEELKEIQDNIVQYSFSLIYDYPDILLKISQINSLVTIILGDYYQKARNRILLIIFFFVFINLISILMMYLSVKVLDNKILNIIIQISKIENYHILFLRNKLKICKKVILNEIRSSKAIDKIKLLYDERNIENKLIINNEYNKLTNKDKEQEIIKQKKSSINKEKNQFDSGQDLIDEDIIKNKITNNNNDDENNIKKNKKNSINLTLSSNNYNNRKRSTFKGLTSIKTLKKNDEKIINIPHYLINNKKIKFKNIFIRNLNLSHSILLFIIVYSLFIGICLPYVINKLKKIKEKINGLMVNDNLQFLLINYYLLNRYSILINTTSFYEKINLSSYESHLYANYSELMKILIRDQSQKYTELIKILDSSNPCDFLLYEQKDYKEDIIKICDSYFIFQTHYLVIISGTIKTLKEIYKNFTVSERNFKNIQQIFHSYNFQIINFKYIVYGLDTLYLIQDSYFLPDLYKAINNLSAFLIIVFIFMVVYEIFYYYQTNILVLNKLIQSINNYYILEKFFIIQEENVKSKK